MRDYTLTHLSDSVLLRDLATLVAADRITTAKMLAHIAEVDTRRLYASAGHPSMFTYCVEELRLSEDAAYKRIQAARAARRFPALFTAIAEGWLHLAGVCLLAPHLNAENVEELIEGTTHRRKAEIETWLVRRFGGRPEPRAIIRAVTTIAPQLAPGQAGSGVAGPDELKLEAENRTPDVGRSSELAPGQAEAPRSEPQPERYLIQVTVEKSTHDKLRHAQALLSHAVPGGNVAKVFDRALDALITQLEKRKFGAAKRPAPDGPRPRRADDSSRRKSLRPKPRKRYVPAPIRRAVWERDQGRCTFVSANGTRCRTRQFLEFDHVEPFARGGRATVAGMRLRCRAHNQYEAERAFGEGFMSRRREEARFAAVKNREARLAGAKARVMNGCAPPPSASNRSP